MPVPMMALLCHCLAGGRPHSLLPPAMGACSSPTNAHSRMRDWPSMPQVWRHMYVNSGALLQRQFGRKTTEPFLRYCWHAGHIFTKRSFQRAWELFGPELNTTGSHRFRTYRPLDEGGDVNPPGLVQHLALIEGLQALNAEYTYTVSAFLSSPAGDHQLLDHHGIESAGWTSLRAQVLHRHARLFRAAGVHKPWNGLLRLGPAASTGPTYSKAIGRPAAIGTRSGHLIMQNRPAACR